jgi:asparagine synthetase B (glutamine-hydrolysing)
VLLKLVENPDPGSKILQDGVALESGRHTVAYTVNATDYVYENERVVILADLCIDRSRIAEVQEELSRIAVSSAEKFAGKCRESFVSGYFVAILEKATGEIHLMRDPSGVKTGFYYLDSGEACLGTVVHSVATAAGVRAFDEEAIFQLLYLRYFYDGFSYYAGVKQLRMGECLKITNSFDSVVIDYSPVQLPMFENRLSESENVARLRQEIDRVHDALAGKSNVVLLSGGIDSCVMLASLTQKQFVSAKSFKLLNTPEDETLYARDIADFLGKQITIVETDAQGPELADDLDEWLLESNTPYDGMWIFGQWSANTHELYFAGQDTRLHTPAVGPIDKLAFALLPLHRARLAWLAVWPSRVICASLRASGAPVSPRRWIRGVYRVAQAFDLNAYLKTYYFHLSKSAIAATGISLEWYDRIARLFELNLARIRSRRQLYNEIVLINWRLQYTDNMQDLQAVARRNKAYLAFPFYDPQLAAFSASIPFRQASRLGVGKSKYSATKTLINKWVLRQAYRERLSDKVFYRDKAVSRSLYILFNGTVGARIQELLLNDLRSERSFIKQYKLEVAIRRFMEVQTWGERDEQYLWLVYYIGLLCFYSERVLNAQPEHSTAGEAAVCAC